MGWTPRKLRSEIARKPTMRQLIRELIETIILALLIFLVIQFTVQNTRVEGMSMDPTLADGQYLIVNKAIYTRLDPKKFQAVFDFFGIDRTDSFFPLHAPRRGEVIVFEFPRDRSRDFVKRVIGVPGDTVEIRRGTVFVNGEELDEPYVRNKGRSNERLQRVPEDSYYVLGDNRRASSDSRDWGMVPAENVTGKAWVSFWPLDQLQFLSFFNWR